MPLVIAPLTRLATGGLATEQSGSAAALFQMLRNLGGSIGIAVLANTVRREAFLMAYSLVSSSWAWHWRQWGALVWFCRPVKGRIAVTH